MLPKCCIPMIISPLIMAASYYLDTPGGCWDSWRGNLAPAGSLPASVCVGLFATLIVMPFYGMATVLRGALRWPDWTRLVMVAALWIYVFGLVFLTKDAAHLGLPSLGIVLGDAFEMWLLSLAYGVPAVITNYWVAARERRDYSP